MRRIVLLAAVLVLAVAAPAQALQGTVESAAQALVSDPVYVASRRAPKLTAAQADELRQRITAKGRARCTSPSCRPPRRRSSAARSTPRSSVLQQRLGRPGTYVLVAGRTFRAGEHGPEVGRDGSGRQRRAQRPLRRHRRDPRRLHRPHRRRARRAAHPTPAAACPAFVPLAFLILVVGGIGLLVTSRIRKQRIEQQRRFDEVHAAVREDVVELGDEIRALDLDVQMPGVDPAARTDYERGARSATTARQPAVDRAQPAAGPRAGRRRARAGPLRDGVRARRGSQGREPPERRPPCFFDPRHGPSTRDVEWSPPDGYPRATVPACEADACASSAARSRAPREVDARRPPHALLDAGPADGPYYGRLLRRLRRLAARAVHRLAAGRRLGRLLGGRRRLRRAAGATSAAATSAAAATSGAAATSAAATSRRRAAG